MAVTLAVIERSHRGAAEQQYAHVLWLAYSLHRQSGMTVLLRGTAAVYALAAAPPGPVQVADTTVATYPDYQETIGRLCAEGGEVFVSAASLEQLGAAGLPLLPGVTRVSDEEIAQLVARHIRWWFL